jgi:hypothetical protein
MKTFNTLKSWDFTGFFIRLSSVNRRFSKSKAQPAKLAEKGGCAVAPTD